MFRLIKYFLVFTIIVISVSSGCAQSNSKLCIIFDKDTKYISVDIPKDSVGASFTIVREGFGTKEKREKALKEWAKQTNRVAGGPTFYFNYIAIHKPVKIDSIKKIEECCQVITVKEYRKSELISTSGAFVFFIKKLSDGSFLKWKATSMAIK